MARISFTGIVSEIVGKLAGSVFQYSYGGFQVHTKGKPRNPQTNRQQLRRGDFGFLSALYRSLTPTQRQTFIDNAPSGLSAVNFFTQTNVNVTLIEEPLVNTYSPSGAVDDFEFDIVTANPEELIIQATGMTTTVPAGFKLLIYATYLKEQQKIFTNPSQYSPIVYLDEGTDLTTPINIIAEFNALYGELSPNKYMCMKVCLIKKSNGKRGNEFSKCINTTEMSQSYMQIGQDYNTVNSDGSNPQVFKQLSAPANTLQNDGDQLRAEFVIDEALNLSGNETHLNTSGGSYCSVSATAAIRVKYVLIIMRTSSSTAKVICSYEYSNGIIAMEYNEETGLDFTTTYDVTLIGAGSAGGSISYKFSSLALIKAAS